MEPDSTSSPAAPAATAAYRERMEQRRTSLQGQLNRIFAPHSRFVWELGCGHGHFLTAYAQAHPGKLCVGIDLVGERIERAQRKRDRAGLANLFFVQAEARLFLATLPAGVLFSHVFILFPDPWPKLRHHKHRVLQSGFLTVAAEHATDDSQLCFRTDFAPYFNQTHALTRAHPHWQITDEPWPFEFNTVFQNRAPEYQSLIARRSQRPHPP
jgi:tRNA (guanine-N7-)-methyltransferase